ncbi:MAG: EAL domain-containing protein [Deltaproteobacteria bacterium]|nr:EAL domain-containing protein [Deltaproteobacteria bacterium]
MMIGFLSVIALIWVAGYFAVHSSQKALRESIVKNSYFLAGQILEAMDRDIYEKTQIFEEYSRDLILQDAVSGSNREFGRLADIQAYIDEKDKEWASSPNKEARPFMRMISGNKLSDELREKTEFYEKRYGFNLFPSAVVTNRYGAVVSMTERAGRYGYGNERWWQEAKKDGSYFGDVRHDDDTGANVMDIGIRVDGAKGEFIGVIKCVLNIETVNMALKEVEAEKGAVLPKSMHLKLVRGDGRLIYSTERFKFLEDASALLREFTARRGEHVPYFIRREGYEPGEGEELSVHAHSKGYRDYKGLGWVIFVDYETADIFSPVAELRYRILAFSLIAAAAAALIAPVISRSLSRPIERLKDAAVEFGRGGMDVSFETASRDEIGALGSAFNRMAEERKRMDEEIKRSEERFRTLVETTSDWVWEVDGKGVYTYASPKVRDILGYEPEDVLGKTPFDLMPAEEAKRVAEIFGHVAAAKKPFSMLANTNLHRDGREVVIETSGVPVLDDEGNLLGYRGIDRDITERSVLYERLRHAALNDALTDLPNRALFLERLKGSVERAKRHHDYLFAVLFLDLDRFKNVNDSLGHLFGDQLLLGVAERLKECVRPYDTIARLGGDEFAVLLEDIKSGRDAIRIAERIQDELTLPFKLEEHEVFATASIGIVLSKPGYDQPEDLLRDADTAMYEAKATGRGCHVIFDEVMHARATAYLRMENDLRQAVEKKELLLHYQPIVSVDEGRIAGFEALVRWRPASGDLIPPAEFIPLAEETGLIKPIGAWIFHEACRQMSAWHKRFPANPPLSVSINLSSRQFAPELIEVVREVLGETGLDPESLRIEITESIIMEKPSVSAALILQLRKMNVKVHLDDFGTGYSSLSYLHRFPIDALKIDRSFVNVMSTDEGAMEITKSVIALAHSLSKRVIAEGVETAGQIEELRRLRCDYYQGYLFSKPLDREAAESLLAGAFQSA